MSKHAYALYDKQEGILHIFAADAHILAKDAVSAFLTQTVIPQSFTEQDDANDLLNQVAVTTGPKQLIETLVGWDLELAMLLI